MTKEIRCAITWLFYGLIGCGIAYFWLDKPVAFWVFDNRLNRIVLLKQVTFIPVIVVAACVIAYLWLLVRFCQERFGKSEKNILLLVNTVALTYFLKSVLKIVFGRYWPMTWINHNPSLIRDGVYGFNWFHTGSIYGAFPSGHAAIMAAGMVALSLNYPKWRWLFFLLWLTVAIGLVGMNYHFVSDVIGGGVLGSMLAYCTSYTLQHSPQKQLESKV